jgi:hypothetical protein
MVYLRGLCLRLGAFAVRLVERPYVAGLKLQLRDMAVQQDKMLLAQLHAIRETQLLELALCPTSPGPEVSDRYR